MPLILAIIALVICIARFAIQPAHASIGGSYQAVAHLFVGGLIGAWIADRRHLWWCFWLAAGMSLVEVFAAVWGRL